MKVPYGWLKDFVDLDVAPKILADKLVSIGFEIEEIISLRDNIKGVKAAQIVKKTPLENSERLWRTEVFDGKKNKTIVTGASNVEIGDVVPVAFDGAVLPDGKVITAGEIRGTVSAGMMCSGKELGLTEEDFPGAGVYGVLVLPEDTRPGTDINDVIGNTDTVFDIAVTANRPDCNSVFGIAREVAGAFEKPLKPLEITYNAIKMKTSDLIKVTVDDFNLCPRYMACAIQNVKVKQSPKIIRDRLRAVGIRPINNLVDVTNYVLFEIGQPMHAFDYDKLRGGEIVVRTVKKGERIVALDEKEYELSTEHLVICDREAPVAVAGVMGGLYSAISENTRTIVLESARFARDSVRHTSRELNLHSDSSARFEKGIDFYSQEIGLKRALTLFYKYEWGDICSDFVDEHVKFLPEKILKYTTGDIKAVLGIDIPEKRAVEILNAIELTTAAENGKLGTTVPAFREDIVGINDIAEEIIRFYGYDKLQSRLSGVGAGGKTASQNRVDKLKNLIAGIGGLEIFTYSFISPKAYDMLLLAEDDDLRKVAELRNPLGTDFSVMRTTLVYSMLKVIASNLSRGNKSARLFEIAKVYRPKALPLSELPTEREKLVVGAYGENEDFYSLKSVAENISDAFRVPFEYSKSELPFLHPGRAASIFANDIKLGFIGEIHPAAADNFGINRRVYVLEIDCGYIASNGTDIPHYKEVSRYQTAERDLALLTPAEFEAGKLLSIIGKTGGELLETCEIFDVYRGGQVPPGKKSVAVNLIFRGRDRTLTDAEINGCIKNILDVLKNYNVVLR